MQKALITHNWKFHGNVFYLKTYMYFCFDGITELNHYIISHNLSNKMPSLSYNFISSGFI